MKKTRAVRLMTLCACSLILGLVRAQSPEILSFQGNGALTWTNSDTNLFYRIEWAASLSDTNGWRSSFETLSDIRSTDNTVTVTVPMFFRIVATSNATARVSSSTQTVAAPAGITASNQAAAGTAAWWFTGTGGATGSLPAAMTEDLQTGLVLYLPFDGEGPVRTMDLSPTGNHGWVHGASWTASGRYGGAYEFDGQDDYIELGPTELYQTQGALSGCAWVFRKDRAVIVMSNYRGGNAYSGQFFFNVDSEGHMDVLLGQGPDQYVRYSAAERDLIPAGEWHHAAFSYDEHLGEGRKMTLYVDGREINRYVIQRDGTGGPVLQTSDRLRLMAHQASGPNCRTQGRIDEVMLFKRALSAQEVRRLCDMGRYADTAGKAP